MGLFRSKKVKIGELSNSNRFSYQVALGDVSPSGLSKHLASTKIKEASVEGRSEVSVFLQTVPEQGGRKSVRIFGWGGEDLAVVDDPGLWSVVVSLYGRMRLNGVRTRCRLVVDPSAAAGIDGLISLALDLPDGFPADIKSSPHLRIVEETHT